MKWIPLSCGWFAALGLLICLPARAEDWPAYRHDNYRSGVTGESLDVKHLEKSWVYTSPVPPQPAWEGPAKWDAYANIKGLKSMRDYDSVFYTIVVGGMLYFGSTADDAVHALDARTGEEKWTYITDGAVRIAPAWWDGRLYFSSDDGHAYCLDAETGALLWKYAPVPPGDLTPSNGKMIPLWPCRSGVLVEEGIAYFTAALLPWKESYLCAVDAKTGKIEGPGSFKVSREHGTMEGALLATAEKIYVPQGRRPPLVFHRKTGAFEGTLGSGGGVFAFITPDQHFFHGPGNKTGWIEDTHAQTRDAFARFDDAQCMVIHGNTAYVAKNEILFAMDREKRTIHWQVPCPDPRALILAGDTLFAGGNGHAFGFDSRNGERLWHTPVSGTADGITAANGGLFISTTDGAIHAFRTAN
ncbi:MAG TPA: PQQ-binding-like beta-propeller repeat protein [bacterium]|nr:PQQ-binding-like beta-propeller repeat protein [bacterium]